MAHKLTVCSTVVEVGERGLVVGGFCRSSSIITLCHSFASDMKSIIHKDGTKVNRVVKVGGERGNW